MLNQTWIDARDIDWTDAMNPLRNPGLRKNNNPYGYASLNDQFTMALRQGKGIEPRIYVGPDPTNQLIAAGATYDYEVPSEPNCWLWALNASGSGPDFLVNVTDSSTGATLFSQPVYMTAICAARSGTSGRGPQLFLPTPHLFTPPSYPVIRVINTDSAPQTCRVTLFTSIEYDINGL